MRHHIRIYDNQTNSFIEGEWVFNGRKEADKEPNEGEIVPHSFRCNNVTFIRPIYKDGYHTGEYRHETISVNDLRMLLDHINKKEKEVENIPYNNLPF